MDSQDNGASRSMVMMRKDAWLAELDEAGNQAKTYTLGNEYAGHVSELNNSLTSENKAASYYITDEQGSIRYMLDQSGEVQNYYQYSAFGETIISEETTLNRLRYNAQTEDELTGLYYLRARYYAPSIGRFTQEDVIYNDGLNLYAYCNSNPVMYSDPSGFAKETCKSKVGGECGSESGSKTVPNPNGKKGGTAHQNTINSIEKTNANGKIQYERKYDTPNGYKQRRYADAVEIVDGEVTKIHQVGKVNKNGTPIMRESKAIDDIMNSSDYNGAPVYFWPYNNPQMGPIIYEY